MARVGRGGRRARCAPRARENVLVAGATLAGAVPWREGSGEGIALSSGHRAAEVGARRGRVDAKAAA